MSETTIERTRMLLEMHRAADAERMARDLIRAEPDEPEPFLLLSQALRAQDRDVEALVAARRATRLDPESCAAWLAVADSACGTGDKQTAQHAAYAAVLLEPGLWVTHYTYGRTLLLGGSAHAREALQCANEAIRLEPNSPDAHNLAGMCLDELHRWKGARTAYEEALRLDPHHAFAANNMGALAINSGRLASGVGHVRRALGTNPQLGVGQRNLDVALTALLWRRCLLVLLPALFLQMFALSNLESPVRVTATVAFVALLGAVVVRTLRRVPGPPLPWLWRAASRSPWSFFMLAVMVPGLTVGVVSAGLITWTSDGSVDTTDTPMLPLLILLRLGLPIGVWSVIAYVRNRRD